MHDADTANQCSFAHTTKSCISASEQFSGRRDRRPVRESAGKARPGDRTADLIRAWPSSWAWERSSAAIRCATSNLSGSTGTRRWRVTSGCYAGRQRAPVQERHLCPRGLVRPAAATDRGSTSRARAPWRRWARRARVNHCDHCLCPKLSETPMSRPCAAPSRPRCSAGQTPSGLTPIHDYESAARKDDTAHGEGTSAPVSHRHSADGPMQIGQDHELSPADTGGPHKASPTNSLTLPITRNHRSPSAEDMEQVSRSRSVPRQAEQEKHLVGRLGLEPRTQGL